jgi:hypothetical protein
MIHIDIIWSESDLNWTVTLTPVIIPDEKARFILRPNSNALFDDNITLTVDSNGLLQTVNTTITDKTVASLGELVKAAGNVFTFGAALAPTAPLARAAGAPQPSPELRTFHKDFDPHVSPPDIPELLSPRIKITDNLAYQFSATFKLEIKPPESSINSEKSPGETIDRIVEIDSKKDSKKEDGIVGIEKIHGIVVRIPIPYQITITETLRMTTTEIIKEGKPPIIIPSQAKELAQNKIIMLPDINQSYIWPISRRYLVSDQTNVTLKDGMIQSIQLSRPSMAAGVVGIPKTILEALVPLPLQIRQSQVNNLQAIYNTLKTKEDIQKLQSQ